MNRNHTGVTPPEDHVLDLKALGPLGQEIEAITNHVMATHMKGRRWSRRFVGRYLTQATLANWRMHGKFPVGFRNSNAQVHDDSGAQLKHVARIVRGGAR